MHVRPVAAGIAAAALVLGSAGLAAADSVSPSPSTLTRPFRTTAVTTQDAEIGQQTVRWSGNDRYETSVRVSVNTWDPESTYVVFLASGEGYADALSAGASTGGEGPLLVTMRGTLPTVVANEIKRLAPCEIVVVGGVNAVSDDVAKQADALADATATKCTSA